MIGFLRFIGVVNAAVWLGGAVFFSFFAAPAFFSPEMATTLGLPDTQFHSFIGRVAQVVIGRYFRFHLICLVIAAMHLLAEWLYLGRPSRKLSFGLLAVFCAITLFGGAWLQPKLQKLNQVRYSNAAAAEREDARKSFLLWHGISQALNLFMIGGLVVHVWRTTNPSDTPRFISSVKFRG